MTVNGRQLQLYCRSDVYCSTKGRSYTCISNDTVVNTYRSMIEYDILVCEEELQRVKPCYEMVSIVIGEHMLDMEKDTTSDRKKMRLYTELCIYSRYIDTVTGAYD